jgi:hypothetical protein
MAHGGAINWRDFDRSDRRAPALELHIDWDDETAQPQPAPPEPEEWTAWRDDFSDRLGRTAAALREFADWAEERGLPQLHTPDIDAAASELEGTVQRLAHPEISPHWSTSARD